jgi:hypothetical protein
LRLILRKEPANVGDDRRILLQATAMRAASPVGMPSPEVLVSKAGRPR